MIVNRDISPSGVVAQDIPKHVAIIMDGNGRWAKGKGLPRIAGHKAGVDAVRNIVTSAGKCGIDVLTMFAFSSENWQRPKAEVSLLMDLFGSALKQEVKKLNRNNVKLKIIGGVDAFSDKLQSSIHEAVYQTRDNNGLTLVIAVNYGGRWDVLQATRQIAQQVADGQLNTDEINESVFERFLALADMPEPDLFIRTGGEQRISNFLLWHLAYTELYFTEALWPDFGEAELNLAIQSFANRQRRFGRTGEQVERQSSA